MELIFSAMPRSGSEFLIKLTRFIAGRDVDAVPISVAPGRWFYENGKKSRELKDRLQRGEAGAFFRERDPQWVKIESASSDLLCWELCAHFPEAKWLTSIRSIEKIIVSHYNLRAWGWSERQVLEHYIGDLVFYEHVAALGKLFVVNVDEPDRFDLQKMLNFLGYATPGKRTADFVAKWYVVNPLEQQQAKMPRGQPAGYWGRLGQLWRGFIPAAEVSEKKRLPPDIDTLRERHPWLQQIEDRYRRLWEACI